MTYGAGKISNRVEVGELLIATCFSYRHGPGASPAEHARHPASCSPPPGPSWGLAKTAAWAARSRAAAAESAEASAGHREVGLRCPGTSLHQAGQAAIFLRDLCSLP